MSSSSIPNTLTTMKSVPILTSPSIPYQAIHGQLADAYMDLRRTRAVTSELYST